MEKETEEQKGKRLEKLNKKIGELLQKNHAGIFAIPDPSQKTVFLQVMDLNDLETFNKQVQENIQKQQEENNKKMVDAIKETVTGEGDKIEEVNNKNNDDEKIAKEA